MISFCVKKRVYIVLLGGVSAFLLLLHMMSVTYSSTTVMAEQTRANVSSSSTASQPGGSPQLAIPSQGDNQAANDLATVTPPVADSSTPTASSTSGNEMLPTDIVQVTPPAIGNEALPDPPTPPAMPVSGSDPLSATPTPPAQLASSSRKGNDPTQLTIPTQESNPLPDGPLLPVAPSVPVPLTHTGLVQNNQNFHGIANAENHVLLEGHNEGNSGNEGLNHGFAQDNSVDTGNQMAGQRKAIGVQANNQLITGHGGASNSGNSSTAIGFDQGNSGNSGVNLGNNQDNSGNKGNQVNNQANVIGTQVNKQGTTVDNDHNVIQHQINYVNLLPDVGLYLGVRPKLEFAISLGK